MDFFVGESARRCALMVMDRAAIVRYGTPQFQRIPKIMIDTDCLGCDSARG